MQPHYWNDAKKHLSAQCPTMKQLIRRYKGEGLRARGDGFYTLVRSVVGQQISVKAADAVWARLEVVVKPLTPKKLLSLSDETLRGCGLSASKVAYAKNVAAFYVERGITSPSRGEVARRAGGGNLPSAASDPHPSLRADLPPEGGGKLPERAYWANLSDEEVIAQLTSIKGIGSWTAEMFLIFHLMRPDVFPVKDLGVLKAINLHLLEGDARLKSDKWLKPKEYREISERWAPYRTVATWYLWRALDPVPVAY
jgi:DNA-3-methyladenine glycosylase II